MVEACEVPRKGKIFCCIAPMPRLNWGIAQTMLAISVAMAHAHASTGEIWVFTDSKGRRPVERVT